MSPADLSDLRNFFIKNEKQMPAVVAAMYSRLFEVLPEAKPLFKGDFDEQRAHYGRMLQSMVCLTRSSHLWPIGAFSGTASLPILDKLGTIHADVGVTRDQFNLMKGLLTQCCREADASRFTKGAERALSFIFDVVANCLVKTCDVREDELARKNRLPLRGDETPEDDMDRFVSGEAWASNMRAEMLH